MQLSRVLHSQWVECALAVLLTAFAVVELIWWIEPGSHPARTWVVAIVPTLAVGLARTAPRFATLALGGAWLVDAFPGPPVQVLAAGLAMMGLTFALGAFSSRPWGVLALVVVVCLARDLRVVDGDVVDVAIDQVFIAFCFGAGLLVAHRTRLGTEQAHEAIVRERGVMARELHDIVAHSVSIMVVQAGTARPLADRTDPELAEVLETIEQTGREALIELRRMLGVLRSEEAAADPGPMPGMDQIEELVEGVRRAGLKVHSEISVSSQVAPGIALCAFRVVQEGLTNALRHAPDSSVRALVEQDGDDLVVVVHNDGGSMSSVGQDLGSGTGLVGLRERVALCGGRMTAGPLADGYQLEVRLPAGAHR